VIAAGTACPRCGRPLDHAELVSGNRSCALCGGSFLATRFDPPVPDTSVPRLAEAGPGEAQACPAHSGNLAVANCDRCGVFACALCRIEVEGRCLCPGCFERLAASGELPSLVRGYRDHARSQSTLFLLGLLVIFVGVVAGPASIYYGVLALRGKKARADTSGRAMVWLLFVLAAIETAASVALYVAMVRS